MAKRGKFKASVKFKGETEAILEGREFNIASVFRVLAKFALAILFWQAGLRKQSGYNSAELVAIIIIMPQLSIGSIRDVCLRDLCKLFSMSRTRCTGSITASTSSGGRSRLFVKQYNKL
jgi:hypothetical protein